MMRDVIVICEGQTEREFCRSVVAPGLHGANVSLAGTLVGKPQRKRGGIREWNVYKQEILSLAKQRSDRHIGVLVDYYAMPDSWPGRTTAPSKPHANRGLHVEDALRNDLESDIGDRFVPCVQLHEFESLLFVKPEATATSLASQASSSSAEWIAGKLSDVLQDCDGKVEQIDDSPATAPSKRLISILPRYDKVAWGVLATNEAGLDDLRQGCPWLERWLSHLESIGEA